MSRAITWPTLIGLLVILLMISICSPHPLSDQGNAFLRNFVNQELLALLGVIVAITLTTTGNLHFQLNKIEDHTGSPFMETRRSVRWSAYSLILLLVAGAVLVVVKPLLGGSETATAVANSIAIVIIAFNVFVLIDLTVTTFKLPAISTLPQKPKE